MSSIIDADPFNNVFTATKGNSTMQGVVTAIYELGEYSRSKAHGDIRLIHILGCLAGALFILAFGDWLGRRWSIMLGATVMILGVILQVTSYPGHVPLAQFCIGRVITGIGNGMNTSTIPTYQAECSRTSNRGLLICIEGSTVAIGTLISYWVDFGASYGPPDLTWRFPIAFQCVFGLFIIITLWFLPESPRWLFARERYEEGERVVAALMGREIAHHDVQLQKTLILDSLRAFVPFFPALLTRFLIVAVLAKLANQLPCRRYLLVAKRSIVAACFWAHHPSFSSRLVAATPSSIISLCSLKSP